MDVIALRPMVENWRRYEIGDTLTVSPSRGWRLEELGMVKAPSRLHYDWGPEWAELRKLIGAPPAGQLAFSTKRSSLQDLRPGEKLLVLRKYGGLGDILISSMIFPDLHDQFPDIHITYACPAGYHTLFDRSGLALEKYETVWRNAINFHRANVQTPVLSQYDLIEDISYPCHAWETLFTQLNGHLRDLVDGQGGNGLRWRNRVDMWSRWMGLKVQHARTCITITEEEKQQARALLKTKKPVLVLSPISNSRTKNFAWYRELARKLLGLGYEIRGLHTEPLDGVQTLSRLPLRMMGAICAVADMIVSVDSSTFHWGGILGVKTVGVFNTNCGETYCKYYPTARWVQTCSTPCIQSRFGNCPKQHKGLMPGVMGIEMSPCYHPEDVDKIVAAVAAYKENHG